MEENTTGVTFYPTYSFNFTDYNITAAYRPKAAYGYSYDHLKYTLFVSGVLTFIFGLIGNTLVIYILSRYPEVRTKSVANYYIFNLAIADIIYLLGLPFTIHATFVSNWVFGNALCVILSVIKNLNKTCSIFTLAALSFDRYIASFHTMNAFRTIKVGKIVCSLIWLASLLLCTPYLMYNRIKNTSSSSNTTTCMMRFPKEDFHFHRSLWTYSELILQLIIPFFVILISYILLIIRLKSIMKFRKSTRIRRPNQKMNLTVLIVCILFLICHTPYYIIEFLNLRKMKHIDAIRKANAVYKPSQTDFYMFMYSNTVATLLVYLSSCCNPILYGLLNDNYRKLYQIVLCCCCEKYKQSITLKNSTKLSRSSKDKGGLSRSGSQEKINLQENKMDNALFTNESHDTKSAFLSNGSELKTVCNDVHNNVID